MWNCTDILPKTEAETSRALPGRPSRLTSLALMRQVPHEEKTEKEKEISVEDMQKIVDANEKLVKELKDGTNTISK